MPKAQYKELLATGKFKFKKVSAHTNHYIIKSLQTINAGEGAEKREPSYTVGGNVNWYNHYGEHYGGS